LFVAYPFLQLEGSVELYTNRVLVAILSLERDFISWPDPVERRAIAERIRAVSGFPSCLGFMDGTLFVLEEKPTKDGEDYYSRKGRYGLAGLIVCDDQKRIRYCYTGWPGCTHDARVFENSALARAPEEFFAGSQYLLADSAYPSTATTVPCFKKLPNQGLSAEKLRFNAKVSRIRVRVEHCIGVLKARFQSLKGLRVQIANKAHLKRCAYWIMACCVLHNFLLEDPPEEDWFATEDEEQEEEQGSAEGSIPSASTQGNSRREQIMSIVLFDE
jgi:hypothetical protein